VSESPKLTNQPDPPELLDPDELSERLERVTRERDALRRRVARLRKELFRLASGSLGEWPPLSK
jgi:hypothetical protein